MNAVSRRLLNQQLICPQFGLPHDVVAWMGAMQGQEQIRRYTDFSK